MPDSITGFPTIKLYPAGAKDSPVEYSGSRTVEDLANFVKENGKYKIDALEAASEKAEEGDDVTASPSATSTETEAPAATGEEKGDHDEL